MAALIISFRSFVPALIAGALVSSACSDLPDLPIGQLRLALASGVGETHYRLAKADFTVSGAAELDLSTDDAAANDTLERALPVGDYAVELQPGWQLERLSAAGSQVVAADLTSANPLSFSISAGELTTLTFALKTKGADTPSDTDGQLRVGIAVDGVGAPGVVISELMKNPEALPDADGEWIELFNAGSTPFSLAGCSLKRDTQQLALDGVNPIPAGGYLTLANGAAPGFTPNVLYSGITLPNTGSFVLGLSCGAQLVDQITVDPSTTPNRAGHSLSLSHRAEDPSANDSAANWCEGLDSYNGDFGTPGAANPDCP